MRYFRTADQTGERIYSEEAVLDEYWDYWCGQMLKAKRPLPMFTRENCILDWYCVNWATELKV